MAQITAYVNCPYCGSLIEVANPTTHARVRQVHAEKTEPNHAPKVSPAYATLLTACTQCGRPMTVKFLFWF